MKLQILGRGCPKCQELESNAEEAVEELEPETDEELEIEKVYDMAEASRMGMMSAPGFAVDGELQAQGKVLEPGEIVEIVEER